MEENKELWELLAKIEKRSRSQARWAGLQCLFSAVALVCCAGALLAVLTVLPQLETLAGRVDTVLQDAQVVSQQLALADWAGVIDDLEDVTEQMAQADLGAISRDVSELVTTSQEGLNETLDKLNSVDFDKLNKAIDDLAEVVEPLAKFFGRF